MGRKQGTMFAEGSTKSQGPFICNHQHRAGSEKSFSVADIAAPGIAVRIRPKRP